MIETGPPPAASPPPLRLLPVDARPSVTQRAVRGAQWTGLLTSGTNLIAFAVFVVLGRLLAPREFGLLAAAMVVLLGLRIIVDAGFSRLLVQRAELTDELVDTAFWTAIATGLVLCAITVAVAPAFAAIFHQPRLTGVVRVLSVILIFVSLDTTQSALAERAMDFRIQAVRRLTAAVVSGIAAVLLAVFGAGVWSLVGQQVILEGVSVVLLWRMAAWRPTWHYDRLYIPELVGFGSWYLGIRVLIYLQQNVDNFLIGLVMGPRDLGLYVVAYRVMVVLNEIVTVTIDRVMLTTFSRLRHDTPALNRAFYSANAVTAYVGLPLYAGIGVLAHPLVVLLFGHRWAGSAVVLQALALAGFIQCQATFTQSYALALGKVRNEMLWTSLVTALELAGFAIAVSHGLAAVAWSLGIVITIMWPLRLVLVGRWRGLRLATFFAQYPALLLAAGSMAAVLLGLDHALRGLPLVVLLVVEAVAGIVVYGAALALLRPPVVRAVLGDVLAGRRRG